VTTPRDRQRTRQRLIDVATRQFAERGFKRVTVRDISHEARANVAAVNYHFRDKLGLYREVLDGAAAVILELTEAAIQAGAGRSPEDKLRAYIRVHCERIFSMGGFNELHRLIHREMEEPTPLLESVIDKVFRPRFEYLTSVVADLLGFAPNDVRSVHCAMSVHMHVVMFRPSPVVDRLGPQVKRFFTVENVIEHITAFAFNGIAAYQRGRKKGRPRPAAAVVARRRARRRSSAIDSSV